MPRSRRPSLTFVLFMTTVLFLLVTLSNINAQDTRPNIIIIYADDLGYGDVGCYGATDIPTPNIDTLAREGLRFTDAHSSASTCTPSRFSILTGCYAWRKKGTNILPGDANLIIEPGRATLPAILQKGGYRTAVVGKWHLGLGDKEIDWNNKVTPGPNEIGFDYSFITPATLDRVPCIYMENGTVLNLDAHDPIQVDYRKKIGNRPTGLEHPELLKMGADKGHSGSIIDGVSRIGYMAGGEKALWQDETMPDILFESAKRFISDNRHRPFFLYFASPEPHVPRIPNPAFAGKTKLGPRGDVIVQFDNTVGKIMSLLKQLGLDNNTLVILSSDNGPILNDGYQDQAVQLNDSHRPSGPWRGGKYNAFEGGTRLPFIVRWTGKVTPGESAALISQVDLLASLASLTNQSYDVNSAPDSMNILPALLGQSPNGRQTLVEQGGAFGFRDGDWKLVTDDKSQKKRWALLFNLKDDPAEKNDLAEKNPGRVKSMSEELDKIMAQNTGKDQGD